MKRSSILAFVLPVLAALGASAFFYITGKSSSQASAPVSTKTVEVRGTAVARPGQNEAVPVPKTAVISLGQDETLLDLYMFNLDMDDEEEQLLVIRRTNLANGAISIVLADYSPSDRQWVRAWEGTTPATKAKTFQVTVEDLIGDHTPAIICSGMNETNRQTLTVYRKRQVAPYPVTAAFDLVFQQEADSIAIEATERPESYKLGQSRADSWPISVWRADTGSANYLDQIRETWSWNEQSGFFVATGREQVAGTYIAGRMAEKVLDGTVETFARFLEGSWYKETSDPRSPEARFVTFQTRENSILFSGSGLIEVYEWENSNSTRYGLYVASRNQSVRNLRRLMDIELVSMDSIQIRVFQDFRIKADVSGIWDGVYRKLGATTAREFERKPSMASTTQSQLSGSYATDDGQTLAFEDGRYTAVGFVPEGTGNFAVFELDGVTALELRPDKGVEDTTGRPGGKSSPAAGTPGDSTTGRQTGRQLWIIEQSIERTVDGQPRQTLKLRRATVGINGVTVLPDQTVVLVKR